MTHCIIESSSCILKLTGMLKSGAYLKQALQNGRRQLVTRLGLSSVRPHSNSSSSSIHGTESLSRQASLRSLTVRFELSSKIRGRLGSMVTKSTDREPAAPRLTVWTAIAELFNCGVLGLWGVFL